jgi:PucR family transcriptional regulator, purine catabolism regulatory protein
VANDVLVDRQIVAVEDPPRRPHPPLTVRAVLAFAEVQRGHPSVLAGHAGLDREVRWAHVLEQSSVSGLLRGGELVLLTGVALPDSNDDLRRWVDDLHATGASAVVIQLGERWARLPVALVRAADRVGLPLVGLSSTVPFVDITRVVVTSVVQSSAAEARAASRVQEALHRAVVDGRSEHDIVEMVSRLTGAPVVLENRNHQALAVCTPPDRDAEAALRDWERRSRRDGAGEGWVVGEVGARGRSWGRLIAQPGPDAVVGRVHRLAVGRGAESLALRRLLDPDGSDPELEARSALLAALAAGRYRDESDGRLRAEAAGFPMTRRTVIAVSVSAPDVVAGQLRDAVVATAAAAGLPLLWGPDGAGLVSCPVQAPLDRVRAWSVRLRRQVPGAVVGVGGAVGGLGAIRGGLADATAAALAEAAGGGGRPVVGLTEVRVRGLLAQLVDDPRLPAFVDRELGPLLDGAEADAFTAVRAYLAEGRNKSAAAQAVRVSRPAFYARLRRAETLLHADLDDPETCLSLQLALIGHQIATAGRPLGFDTSGNVERYVARGEVPWRSA